MQAAFSNDIKSQVEALPSNPGIYKFFNSEGVIIYIGKAKNLKKRVSSYFTKNHENNKTRVLVKKIFRIEHMVVASESDALLLENNLIKQWQPRYNVLLKDDKTYPWICVTREEFPRILYTRNKSDFEGDFYGPYTSLYTIKTLISLLRILYRPRTCRLALSESKIAAGKFDVCLEYHIGNCKAPCVGLQSRSEYATAIEAARVIIRGKLTEAIAYLHNEMQHYANQLQFEKAQQVKEKIAIVENYRAKSTVVSNTIKNVDVYGLVDDISTVYISYLKVLDGAIIHSFNTELKRLLNESCEDLLLQVAYEMWTSTGRDAPEAIVPFYPEFIIEGLKWTVPQKGDKLELLNLAQRNARFFMLEKQKIIEKKDPDKAIDRKLNTLKKDLRLSVLPDVIECFDNSNLQGTHPVASCVVFKNARPSKKDYRHFNIKTVVGADDFASMEELINRRYSRLLAEKAELPKLIVIDGGKGQLNAAVASLTKLGLEDKIAIMGIAKRLEEIYFPGDSIPLYLDKNSESLKIIRHLRDEAHRFAIGFHRDKRSSDFLRSELEQIPGIGEKTIAILLKKFSSVDKIQKLDILELEKAIGKPKAKILTEYFANR
ncbi:MAG TPA: excinuclease ABC subunit UvrC [Bacteroidales bacterium]|nr:excinuclease ABC subunit UvrC [Bacteroidales bacterium]